MDRAIKIVFYILVTANILTACGIVITAGLITLDDSNKEAHIIRSVLFLWLISGVFLVYVFSRFIVVYSLRKAITHDLAKDFIKAEKYYITAVNYVASEVAVSRLLMIFMEHNRYKDAKALILRWPNYSKFLLFYSTIIQKLNLIVKNDKNLKKPAEIAAAAAEVLPPCKIIELAKKEAPSKPNETWTGTASGLHLWRHGRLFAIAFLGAAILTIAHFEIANIFGIAFIIMAVLSFIFGAITERRWRMASGFVAQAEIAVAEGNPACAYEAYEQYLRKIEWDKDILLRMAAIAMEQKDWDRAEQHLLGHLPLPRKDYITALREQMASEPAVIFCLIQNYKLVKRLDDTRPLIDKLAKIPAWQAPAEYERSIIEELSGNLEDAKYAIRKAAELAPLNVMITKRLCLLYGSDGEAVLKDIIEKFKKEHPAKADK